MCTCTITTPRTSTKRPRSRTAPQLRDSGSSRSFPQRSDDRQARKRRLHNPRREKVRAPSLLRFSSSFLLSLIGATTTIAISFFLLRFPTPSPRTSADDRLLASTADCLQTNPPTFPVTLTNVRLGCCPVNRPGRTYKRTNKRTNERDGIVTAAGGVQPARLHCAKLQRPTPAKKSDVVLEKLSRCFLPLHPSPSLVSLVPNLISFYSAISTAPFLTSSPTLLFSSTPLLSRIPTP